MDWTFQSKRMQNAEADFEKETGHSVYFGVGTNGTEQGPDGLGKCFQLNVENVDKPIIVQAVNTGSDVAVDQFDLQVGDGGFGAFNDCAGDEKVSMFAGGKDGWGNIYGGVDNKADCMNLPKYPQLWGDNPPNHIDNLQDLCSVSFDKGVRLEGGGNPTITNMCEVSCPSQLTSITGMIPKNPGKNYTCNYTPVQNSVKCGDHGNAHCLTRMLDCRKPSASWKDNVHVDDFVDGAKIVQPCGQDGYTRIDNRCGGYPNKETGACYN